MIIICQQLCAQGLGLIMPQRNSLRVIFKYAFQYLCVGEWQHFAIRIHAILFLFMHELNSIFQYKPKCKKISEACTNHGAAPAGAVTVKV